MKNEKKKFTLNSMFYNNKLLLVFSFIVAFILWLSVTLFLAPEIERVIENVPVSIELSQAMKSYGLKPFGESDYKVNVTVKGKRYIVSPRSLSADDIIVKADTKYVNSAGKYTLQIVASNADGSDDFEITSLSLEVVDVYFDVEKVKEFEIHREIIAPKGIVKSDYYVGDCVLSDSTVKITGPETEIDKIVMVNATANIDEPITNTQVFSCNLTARNSLNDEPKYLSYETSEAAVTVTVPVYKRVTLDTGINFVNSPAEYISSPLKYTVTPSNADFGVAESKLESYNGVMPVMQVDFSQIGTKEQKFKVGFDSESAVLIDDSTDEFTVTVDPGNVSEKKFNVPLSSVVFAGTENDAEPAVDENGSLEITVIGPASSLQKLNDSSFAVKADLNGITEKTGTVEVPASIAISDTDDCWVFGEYTVNVSF